MSFVKTTITLPEKQSKFLRENGYSASRLFQNHISKLMKNSEGHSLQAQPSDEPLSGDSNG